MRFVAEGLKSGSGYGPQLCPPLYCVLLTRSFLTVLGGLGGRTKEGQVLS